MNKPHALFCQGITKHFGSNPALRNANLSVKPLSIHALVGENGAGKSTLINILAGLLKPDQGRIEVFGTGVKFQSALDAVAAGIGVVHQHFLLAEALTVAENIALGMRTSVGGLRFNKRRAEDETRALSEQTGLSVDPRACVGDLPVGLRQRVEILKALSRGARILLLDEPTAVLAPPEVKTLFDTLLALRAAGRTLLIVTHKLDEVFALASETTVLRAGETVYTGNLSELNPNMLAEKVIGREQNAAGHNVEADAPSVNRYSPPSIPEIVLEARNIDLEKRLSVECLQIHAGEILGIAGVEGNGQDELAGLIAGTFTSASAKKMKGTLNLLQTPLLPLSVCQRSELGLAYIPSDRQREALILEMTLNENLHLRRPMLRPLPLLHVLDHAKMARQSAAALNEYGVVPANEKLTANALSGGNQQKVVAARELSHAPRLVLACNPTRGLDIAAAASLQQRLMLLARERGAAVLLISSDLDEVLLLSDRVMVLYRSHLTDMGARGVTKDDVGRAMVGAT